MRVYAHRYKGKNSWSRNDSAFLESDLMPAIPPESIDNVLSNFKEKNNNGEYIDTHCWAFDSETICFALNKIKRFGMIQFNEIIVEEFVNDFMLLLS